MHHFELSASELYTAEGGIHIANTRNDTVEPQVILTSATASFKFTYKAKTDVEDLPLPHMHTHTHTHTHTRT